MFDKKSSKPMKSLKHIFRNLSDLQKRILFTLGALIVYRVGSYIPLPGVNAEAVLHLFDGDNGMMGILNEDFKNRSRKKETWWKTT